MGEFLFVLVGMAWLCEKFKIKLKFIYLENSDCVNFFENATLNYSTSSKCENPDQLKESIFDPKPFKAIGFDFFSTMANFGLYIMPTEYGHKIISELSVKKDFQQQADEWYRTHIKGNCVGVHYRGTDVDSKRKIKMDSYIQYIKNTLDNDCYIFACSDQAQFIGKMEIAFPGRVASRDIRRSYTGDPIHVDDDLQQKKDAFIDILILAKTKLIYTTGSRFVDCARLFNPSIKFIYLDPFHTNINSKHIPNYIPIPKKHLIKKIRAESKKQDTLAS